MVYVVPGMTSSQGFRAASQTAPGARLTGGGADSGSGADSTENAGASTKNMFLQLLVAQIQNQDPLNPTDSTQFLTQLAQMQQLEQSINMGQDVSAIRQALDALAASGVPASQITGGSNAHGHI